MKRRFDVVASKTDRVLRRSSPQGAQQILLWILVALGLYGESVGAGGEVLRPKFGRTGQEERCLGA